MLAAVTIGVFRLFHPVEFDVQPVRGSVLVMESDGRTRVLENRETAEVRGAAKIAGRGGGETDFILSVPGKIRREFRGLLEIREQEGHLLAIVKMDLETAVASIVAAEGPGAPMEELKAQAIVARSFLLAAHGRHHGFDFCDTTHCQYLRQAPPSASASRRAQEATKSLALVYEGRIIPALYSANCGGHTRSLAEAGWRVEGYPYFAVDCGVQGKIAGHRIGMCQMGAVAMARLGATFREILARYFPSATIEPR